MHRLTEIGLPCLLSVIILASCAAVDGIGAQSLPTSDARPDVTMGALSGPDHLLFGRVRALHVTSDGTVLAVDNMNARVSAFTLDGGFIGDAGRRGQGPGEFIHPRAVAAVEETVYVLDDGRMRFVRFSLREAGLTFQDEVSLPFTLYDFCAVDEQIIGLGFHEGRPLHAFSHEGELLHSFGEPFVDDPFLASRETGYLTCLEGPQEGVAVAAINYPIVDVYEIDGAHRWRATLDGFQAPVITPSGAGGIRFGPPEAGGTPQSVISLVDLGGRILVQWGEGERGMSGLEDIHDVHSLILDAASGEPVEESRVITRIDAAWSGWVFSRGSDPFPAVRGYRIGEEQW